MSGWRVELISALEVLYCYGSKRNRQSGEKEPARAGVTSTAAAARVDKRVAKAVMLVIWVVELLAKARQVWPLVLHVWLKELVLESKVPLLILKVSIADLLCTLKESPRVNS